MYIRWHLVSRRILTDAVSEITLLTAIAFVVCKRIVPFAFLCTVVIVVLVSMGEIYFGFGLSWFHNEQIN